MVLRTDLDHCDAAMQFASTDVPHEYFCYRCNMSKTSKHRGFWHTPAGLKVLCRPCAEEIQSKVV